MITDKGIFGLSAASSSITFSLRVEKYIEDFRKGLPGLSKPTSNELSLKERINADYLVGKTDLSLLYSTMLTYDKQARFTHGVNVLVENMKMLEQKPHSEFSVEA